MEQNNELYHLLVDSLGDPDRTETIRLIRENHAEQLRTLRAREAREKSGHAARTAEA